MALKVVNGHVVGLPGYHPEYAEDRSKTDLDDDLHSRLVAHGYRWNGAERWPGIRGEQRPWHHWVIAVATTRSLNFGNTAAGLRRQCEWLEEEQRLDAYYASLGWQYNPKRHWEWTRLNNCLEAGGDVAALIRQMREDRSAEVRRRWEFRKLDRTDPLKEAAPSRSDEEIARHVRNIKRWHKKGLSSNEMVKRMGVSRQEALALIRIVTKS
jgi:hypothetical protein